MWAEIYIRFIGDLMSGELDREMNVRFKQRKMSGEQAADVGHKIKEE